MDIVRQAYLAEKQSKSKKNMLDKWFLFFPPVTALLILVRRNFIDWVLDTSRKLYFCTFRSDRNPWWMKKRYVTSLSWNKCLPVTPCCCYQWQWVNDTLSQLTFPHFLSLSLLEGHFQWAVVVTYLASWQTPRVLWASGGHHIGVSLASYD